MQKQQNKENTTELNAKQLYEKLLSSAGKPIVYDTVVEQIVKKFGSDEAFISEVHKKTGIPTETITREIVAAATAPVKGVSGSINQAKDNPNGPVQQESPMQPQNAPGLNGEMPNMQPPQQMQAAAAANQSKGMSPGQALNVANQQQTNTPAMKKGGLLTKPTQKEGGLEDEAKMEYGGSVSGGADPAADQSRIGLQDGGDMGEIDLMGKHRPGMMDGGLAGMQNFNNSVEMNKGGSNEPPPGALPEEVADDQPVMLSKGEFVLPANVVRYLGLETIIALRDKALKGLAAMEAAGQIRRPGDGKNPGEEGEVEPQAILGGKTTKQLIKETPAVELLEHHAIEEIEEHAELLEEVEELEHGEEDEDDLFMKSGGDLSNAPEGSSLAMKVAHLKHKKGYGYQSQGKPNNLSQSQPGGGPVGLKSGGTLPPDNTTGIDPMPSAYRDSKSMGPRYIGRNLGKSPLGRSKDQSSLTGKGQLDNRKMAAGGEVAAEQAGKYLNDLDMDKETQRDTLPDYESVRDWTDAMGRTPNFGVGSVIDAITGRGFFAKEDPAYVTVAERRAGLGSDELANTLEKNAASQEERDAIQADNEKNAGDRNAGLEGGPQIDIGTDQ